MLNLLLLIRVPSLKAITKVVLGGGTWRDFANVVKGEALEDVMEIRDGVSKVRGDGEEGNRRW